MGYHLKTTDCEAGCTSKTAYPRLARYEAGLRFFTPGTGRWLNRDPLGELGGLNRGAFVRNNPLMFADALGLLSYDGRSSDPAMANKFTVKKCEIAIIYGHGSPTRPHEIDVPEDGCYRAYFVGCFSDTTNKKIPPETRLVPDVGRHRTTNDGETFEKLKELRETAQNIAQDLCACCKEEGVWIRYVHSPSDELWVRFKDWAKGNTSRNEPTTILGGGKWPGDEHINCK